MARAKIIESSTYKGYEIQVIKKGSRQEILDALINSMEYMWFKCSRRLCVCHLDVKSNNILTSKSNKYITEVLDKYRRKMLKKKIKIEYIWCREIGKVKGDFPHYHFGIILDGNRVQSIFEVARVLNSLMSIRLGSDFKGFHINPPKSDSVSDGDSYMYGKKVTKKNGNLFDAIHWLSYLAKVDTKDSSRHWKSYGHSKGYEDWLKSTTNTRECLKSHSLMNEKINESKLDHSVKTSVDYSIDKHEVSQSNIESKGANKLVDNPGIRSKFKTNTSGWSKGFWCNYNKISQHYVDDNREEHEFIPINAISFPLLDEILAFFEETPEDARSHNEDSSYSMENELLANLEIREDNFQSKPKTKTKKCVPQDEYVIDIFSV